VGTAWEIDIEMFGDRLAPFDHELQEPLQPDADRAADSSQRDPFQYEVCNKRPLLLGDHRMVRIEDKGAATEFAAVVLFPCVSMTVSFVPR
jgi:hypothetical protein